jgi:hypothetical protein
MLRALTMLSKSFHLLALLVLTTAGLHAVVAQRKSTKPAVSKVKAAKTIVAVGHELLSSREPFDELI